MDFHSFSCVNTCGGGSISIDFHGLRVWMPKGEVGICIDFHSFLEVRGGRGHVRTQVAVEDRLGWGERCMWQRIMLRSHHQHVAASKDHRNRFLLHIAREAV